MKLEDGFPKVSAKFWSGTFQANGRTHYSVMTYLPRTTKTKRLFFKIRAGKFLKIYIKVEYGMKYATGGKMEMFYNEATCYNKEDALLALKSFLE
jgi:hypothetical protein